MDNGSFGVHFFKEDQVCSRNVGIGDQDTVDKAMDHLE